LRTEQRAVFLEKLQNAVEGLGVRPFQVRVTGLDWVPNFERTRWFLVLRLKRPENDALNLLLAVTNCVARDSGLEMLYADQESREDGVLDEEPRLGRPPTDRRVLKHGKHGPFSGTLLADCTSKFHFSIAWQLEEPGKRSVEIADALESVEPLRISCDSLKVKIGNVIHNIPLPERRLSEQGLGRF
jgi:hypothetical protein